MENQTVFFWWMFTLWCNFTQVIYFFLLYNIQRVCCVVFRICSLSQSSLFKNISYWSQWHDELRLILETSVIVVVYTLYLNILSLMVIFEKHQYISNLDYMPRPSIFSYLWRPCKSSTWKFHITLFSNLVQAVNFLLHLWNWYWSHLLMCYNVTGFFLHMLSWYYWGACFRIDYSTNHRW